MCGIVGYSGKINKACLGRMVEAVSHRGPDDRGMEYFGRAALGNSRLAVIDLSSRGHQPMFNKDKSLCIVYNGEIYNYREIKKTLEGKYQFKSETDTEVILSAYREWGRDCLSRFNGMFSFVIYDIRNQLLFGARDRLGQKPLKYYWDKDKFIFASELKAIIACLGLTPEIDEVAIDNFLTLQYVPAPRTGFKRIYKLPAAHYFVYKNKKLSIRQYWSLDLAEKLNLSRQEWGDLILREIDRAVKLCLESDVSMGALLSGGLDSGLIVAMMARNSSRRVRTFSIGFEDEKFDETRDAREVARLYNTRHTTFQVTAKDLLKNLPRLTDYYDEPIGDNSILPTLLVCRLARSKVKVALTGDGGDENFAGYDRYNIVNFSSYLAKLPHFVNEDLTILTSGIFKLYPDKYTERLSRFFRTLNSPFYQKYMNYNCFFINDVKKRLYTDDFEKTVNRNNTFERYKKLYDKKLDDLDNALKIDIQTYLADDLLSKTDTASMSVGLELRAPFLDHLLVEKMAQIPSGLKARKGIKKSILKEMAVKNNLLPKDIVYKRKQGFNIPQNKWFKSILKDFIYETILSKSLMTRNIFDQTKLKKYLDDYYQTNLNYDNNIFALVMLSLWVKKYL